MSLSTLHFVYNANIWYPAHIYINHLNHYCAHCVRYASYLREMDDCS